MIHPSIIPSINPTLKHSVHHSSIPQFIHSSIFPSLQQKCKDSQGGGGVKAFPGHMELVNPLTTFGSTCQGVLPVAAQTSDGSYSGGIPIKYPNLLVGLFIVKSNEIPNITTQILSQHIRA